MEKEKLDLEGAKNEAEQYLEMQKEVATRQHSLYQRYMSVLMKLPSSSFPGRPSPSTVFNCIKFPFCMLQAIKIIGPYPDCLSDKWPEYEAIKIRDSKKEAT